MALAAAAAADTADWAACQGQSGPASIDQLLDQCGDAAGCAAPAPVDLDRIVAGCTAVIDAPGEPPLRRALAAYQRGLTRLVRGDRSDAIIDFSFALSVKPDLAEAYERRGAAYARAGERQHAIADLSAAIALKPGLARAWSERGQALFAAHQDDRAISDLTQALALRPDNVIDLNNRCVMRATVGRDLAGALADCDRAVALAPRSADVLNSRGFAHLRMKAYRAAAADYHAALALAQPSDAIKASSLYGRGLARLALGQTEAGRADIAAAIALAPAVGRPYAAAGLTP